ncbi:MAG: Nif3-like dinuclear metal center hexameric protein [Candidatus Heimdallarchaeota archaeon]
MSKTISIADLRRNQTVKSNLYLIDVRDSQAFQKGHIQGAVSIPLPELEGQTESLLPRNEPIVVYCKNAECEMSSQAVSMLQKLGVQNIQKLEGGFDEWKALGYPIATEGKSGAVDPFFPHSQPIPPVWVSFPEPYKAKMPTHVSQRKTISSDDVVALLEDLSPPMEFEYLGYEAKGTDDINSIYLMINPDPRNFSQVTSDSLVICHHKVSIYSNRICETILSQAKAEQYNLYNYHLAWDVMEGGIGDSFLFHLGIAKEDIEKVDLTYKGHVVPRLGSIINKPVLLEEMVARLSALNVRPSVIVNPLCYSKKVGYIPGGGFVDQLIVEMQEYGVDVLISSDPNWMGEIIARELGLTLIAIDHYISERYGLQAMKKILATAFPEIETIILEDLTSIHCPCCSDGLLQQVAIK